MHKVVLRSAFFALPLAAAAWAGCSDDPASLDLADAASETSAAPDAFASPDASDAAPPGPRRDCAKDVQADGLQRNLDCTGLYADFASRTVAAEAKPYTPAFEFWSDDATKARFLYLPPGAKIDITSFDEWKFPNGTKVWKEFSLDGRRIETRLYQKAKDSWRHTTYRWNAAQTEAVRMDSGELVQVGGGVDAGQAPYQIPNTGQCDSCHVGRDEPLLGVDAVSLGLPSAKGVTLATLAAEGRFSVKPPATTLAIPDDGTTKAAAALGWMHANCGSCHNANLTASANFTQLFLLLKPSQLLPDAGTAKVADLDGYKTTVGVASTRADSDAGPAAVYTRIVAKDPGASLVSILSGRRVPVGSEPSTAFQMPGLVTRVPDSAGHASLDAWINALP